jgi:hypothetical protein
MNPRFPRAILFFLALGIAFAAALSAALRVGAFAHDGPLGPALYAGVPVATVAAGVLATALTARRRPTHLLLALLAVPFSGLVMGATSGSSGGRRTACASAPTTGFSSGSAPRP